MKYQLDKSKINDIPCVALYRPNKGHYSPSVIACFMINDGWNEQALLELKDKAEADILVGLQTDDHKYERLDIIEGIVRCQPDEVNDVIALLDARSASTIIGIDVADVISLFECGYLFQFVQVDATGESKADLIKLTTEKLVDQLKEVRDTNGLIVEMASIQSLPLEDIAYISDTIENSLFDDDAFIYYCLSITDKPNSFQLKAIYIEE